MKDSRRILIGTSNAPHYVPTASPTHFFMWLVFRAPASFLSFESVSQVVVASRSHLVMKLLSAAPASFLSAAWNFQAARRGPHIMQRASPSVSFFMDSSHGGFAVL